MRFLCRKKGNSLQMRDKRMSGVFGAFGMFGMFGVFGVLGVLGVCGVCEALRNRCDAMQSQHEQKSERV